MLPEQFSAVYAEARAATNRAVNMNFFAHAAPGDDEQKAARARALMAPFYMGFNLGEVPEVAETTFPFGEAMLKAVLEARPRIVSFHLGLPEARFVTALKEAGSVILCTATTPAEARDLEARGVDAIVAQGAARPTAVKATTLRPRAPRPAPWHWCRRSSTRSVFR